MTKIINFQCFAEPNRNNFKPFVNSFKSLALIGLTLTALITSCSGPKSPEFVGLVDIKVKQTAGLLIQVDAQAKYHNPNIVGANLEEIDLDVSIDDKAVTKIVQNTPVEIPAESDFSIPIAFQFDPVELSKNKGFFKDILEKVLKNEMTVTYKGFTTISVMGQSFKVPIDYSEKVKLGIEYE